VIDWSICVVRVSEAVFRSSSEHLDRPFGVLHGLAQIEELLVRGLPELARADGVLALVRLTAERGGDPPRGAEGERPDHVQHRQTDDPGDGPSP
jgi:hypothetical protein